MRFLVYLRIDMWRVDLIPPPLARVTMPRSTIFMKTEVTGESLERDDLRSIRDRIAEGLPVQPESRRLRWLEAADRWRTGNLARRAAAEQVYRTLAADLDSGSHTGRERITWLLRSAVILDECLYEIALRFESPTHRIDRHLARLTAAQCLGTLGRLDEAMQLTELLLAEHFETGSPHELNVLALFVALLAWQRREIEMVAGVQTLERRMDELEVTDPGLRLMLRHRESSAWRVLELPAEELLEDLADLLRLSEGGPESVRWKVRTWVESARAEIEAQAGNSIGARMHFANFESHHYDGATTPWSFADLAPIMGRIALLEGNPERTLLLVEKARASTDRSHRPHTQSKLALLALEAGFALGDDGVIDRELQFVLMGLDPATSPCTECTGVLWRTGLELARLLRRHETREEVALTALSLAADALLRRVEEIDRLATAYPKMFDGESPRILRFRQQFEEKAPELVEHLRTAIAERGREWSSLYDPHGQLQVCAWCLRARDDRGAWIPVGHLMPSNDRISVSHGICERCASDQLTEQPRSGDSRP